MQQMAFGLDWRLRNERRVFAPSSQLKIQTDMQQKRDASQSAQWVHWPFVCLLAE